MKIKSIRIRGFKRFADLTISELPPSARIVMLAGPNGTGKSSLFDAFNTWHEWNGGRGAGFDPLYHRKAGLPETPWGTDVVQIEFHELLPESAEAKRKLVYIRSAYRIEADFNITGLSRAGSIFDAPRPAKMIDVDAAVSDNYRRLVSQTVAGVYDSNLDDLRVSELRDRFIGEVRSTMQRVFPSLNLVGVGDPLGQGTFLFEKDGSAEFHYKNLSGGEKAAFDLLLDFVVKTSAYDDSIICIDEPDSHLNPRLHGPLLHAMYELLPPSCQLWLATHSAGMMRKARDLGTETPGSVAFLDFENDFDEPATLSPVAVDRAFWGRVLDVALDDLARLVAPARVVLCEGGGQSEFDARCYRRIFDREFPDTDFVSVGAAGDVQHDRLQVGKSIQTLVSGTEIVRLIDRDDRTDVEIAAENARGVRVLSLRSIESYLFSDELIEKLCDDEGRSTDKASALEKKQEALSSAVSRGRSADDVKSAGGELYNSLRTLLGLTQRGSTNQEFLQETMATLMTPETTTYQTLRRDVFG